MVGPSNPKRKPTTPQDRLKVVVRRLPADLPEAIFWKSVKPWIVPSSPITTTVATEGSEVVEVVEIDKMVAWSKYRAGKIRRK